MSIGWKQKSTAWIGKTLEGVQPELPAETLAKARNPAPASSLAIAACSILILRETIHDIL